MLVRRLYLVVATALAFLWPALVNGGPFWFPDTSNYIRAADAAAVVLTHSPSQWSDRLVTADREAPAAGRASASGGTQPGLVPTRPVLTGRSIYYGLLIYLPMRMAGPWAAILLQAVLCSAFLWYCFGIAARNAARPRPVWLAAGIGSLALLTPLPFYVCMLMPDIYSGLIVLGLASVIAYWDRLVRRERAMLILCCGAMATLHTTHMLLTIAVGTIAVGMLIRHRLAARPLLTVVPVLVIGILAELAFTTAVTHALNSKPMSPPFLSARLTAAGPGTDYLRKVCPRDPDRWELCRDVAKLPLNSDSFLWSSDPESGVFQPADDARKQRIAAQDKRFALAVVESDPVGVIGSSVHSTFAQLFRFDLLNFNYDPSRVIGLAKRYPPGIAAEIAATRAARRNMPTVLTVGATVLSTLFSLILIGYLLIEVATGARRPDRDDVTLALLLIGGVLVNAVICGSLSGPHARYQMRIIWLMPYAAAVLALARAGAPPFRKGGTARKDIGETMVADRRNR